MILYSDQSDHSIFYDYDLNYGIYAYHKTLCTHLQSKRFHHRVLAIWITQQILHLIGNVETESEEGVWRERSVMYCSFFMYM